jgi:hypothetical protein
MPAAKLTDVVVLPVPPLWLNTAMTFGAIAAAGGRPLSGNA